MTSLFFQPWLCIVPPLIAIVLALKTREVYSSLLLGIMSGVAIFVARNSFEHPLVSVLEETIKILVSHCNFEVIFFTGMLGALIYVMMISGSTLKYAEFVRRRIRSRRGGLLTTFSLGLVFFVEDNFSCLASGAIARPLTDSFRISREKLAYVVDSTSSSVCLLMPASSWVAVITAALAASPFQGNAISLFTETIPFNIYAILCVTLVAYLCWSGRDWGPMREAEEKAILNGIEDSLPEEDGEERDGSVIDMLLPLATLVVLTLAGILYTGGYWSTGQAGRSLVDAIRNCDSTRALSMAIFGCLIVAFLLYIPRKLMTARSFAEGAVEGVTTMIPAQIVLVLSWGMSAVCGDLLQAGAFFHTLLSDVSVFALMIPACVYIVSGFLSFSTGTAWATISIVLPIAVEVSMASQPEMTVVNIAACLSGALFGDHCSPVSDTTVLSSSACECGLMRHVTTQFPYAVFIGMCSLAGFLALGISGGSWLAGACTSGVLFAVCLAWRHSRSLDVRALQELCKP